MANFDVTILNILLSGLSISLLVFTAYLSSQNYKSQKRFGIRESLEQSDDLYLSGSTKLKPVLHDFTHHWARASRTRILIEFYSVNRSDFAGVSQLQTPLWYLEDGQIERLLDSLSNISGIENAELTDTGVLVTCQSHEPVEIRNSVRAVMIVIRNSFLERTSETTRERLR